MSLSLSLSHTHTNTHRICTVPPKQNRFVFCFKLFPYELPIFLQLPTAIKHALFNIKRTVRTLRTPSNHSDIFDMNFGLRARRFTYVQTDGQTDIIVSHFRINIIMPITSPPGPYRETYGPIWPLPYNIPFTRSYMKKEPRSRIQLCDR